MFNVQDTERLLKSLETIAESLSKECEFRHNAELWAQSVLECKQEVERSRRVVDSHETEARSLRNQLHEAQIGIAKLKAQREMETPELPGYVKEFSTRLQKTSALYDAASLPEYRCHKNVKAAKILSVETSETGAGVLTLAGVGPVGVSVEFMAKHKPHPGMIYVLYADGYDSVSPKEAFEEGYTLIS